MTLMMDFASLTILYGVIFPKGTSLISHWIPVAMAISLLSPEMATGACPIGMMQWSLMHMRFPFMAVGIVLLSGAVLGRAVCGWLCPFGFLCDAFDRASLKKYWLPFQAGYLKFLVLMLIFTAVAWPAPYFCSNLCQSGSIFGLLP